MEKFEAQFYNEYEEDQKKGEILPIEILIKNIKNKWKNAKTINEKIDFIKNFNIDETISIEFLEHLIENKYDKDEFKNFFNEVKFSIIHSEKKKLEKILNYLPQEYINNELNFFLNNHPKQYFIEFYNNLNNISKLNKTNKEKRKLINNLIDILYENFNFDNDKLRFGIIVPNIGFQYCKLFFDFYDKITLLLLQKKEKNNKKKFIIHTPNKNKTSKKEELDYEEYEKDDDYIYNFNYILKLIENFKPIFESFDNNEERNIKKLIILLEYLRVIEKYREYNIDHKLFDNIIESLSKPIITSQILDKCKIYKDNKEITKETFETINEDDIVKIHIEDINKEFMIKLKHYNINILKLPVYKFYLFSKNPDIEYLTVEGLLNNNFIKCDKEIELNFKNSLYSTLCSNNIKNAYITLDERFEHNNLIYAFEGKYKKQIFEEIYKNTFFIPFLFKIDFGYTNRHNYSIFINSKPYYNKYEDAINVLNIIQSKQNDYLHEIFHLLTFLYGSNLNKLKFDTPPIKKNKLELEINDNGNKIKFIQNKEIDDFSDAIEIWRYGYRPNYFNFFSSLYALNENNCLISGKEFRKNYLEFEKCNIEFKKDELFDENKYNININEDKDEVNNNNENKDNNRIKELIKSCKLFNSITKIFKINRNTIKNISYDHSIPQRKINDNDIIIYNAKYICIRGPDK